MTEILFPKGKTLLFLCLMLKSSFSASLFFLCVNDQFNMNLFSRNQDVFRCVQKFLNRM